MDIKTFKSGIEYLARATNQREKEPDPFLLQVGRDGSVSLVAGDRTRTYIWRTGLSADLPQMREAVSSKMLVQAAKVLKGKIEVDIVPTKGALRIKTTAGGSVNAPYLPDLPELLPPSRIGSAQGFFRFEEGRLAQLVKSFDAAGLGNLTRGVQFLGLDGRFTVIATDEHKAFITYFNGEIDGSNQWGNPVAFWNALRGSESIGDVTFYQLGLGVRSGEFEAYSNYLKMPVMDMRERYFSNKPEVMAITNRKVLIDSVKGITPDVKNGTIDISLQAEGKLSVSQNTQHMGLPLSRHKGWGRIGISAEYLLDVLGAMDGKEVILAWHENVNKPLGLKSTSRQGDFFVIAPRVQA